MPPPPHPHPPPPSHQAQATSSSTASPSTSSSSSFPAEAASPLLSAFTSFLTIAIHSILYHRALYPQTSFLAARAFNLAVRQSRHPGLCAWINDAVAAVSSRLRTGSVSRIALVVHGPPPNLAVRERWIFDVGRFPNFWGTPAEIRAAARAPPPSHQLRPDEQQMGGQGADSPEKINWADVHEALRAALQRLAFAAQAEAKLPQGCTFTLAVELREDAEAPIGHPQEWIPSEAHLQPPTKERPDQGEALRGASTRPIRSVRANPLFFECWLERGSEAPDDDSSTQSHIGTYSASSS
ncbi:DNA-binding protein [Trichoderma citrinoviride]|uniref:DNA-binding protein n=1 Tax=Trichoderma citrinoviride TaxID=58853 RepID=A0A2T4BC22_9HYPO|nr:DNA-binding protein [Trichoderma citrinoviride]PTB66739.1 DNA-binding protein [Trichoderma citrinoviride]